MNKFENEINQLVNKILSEEITKKSKMMSEKIEKNEWVEIKSDDELDEEDFELDLEEEETQEGNTFTGALADAKKKGESSFEVDGKKYSVKESKNSLRLTEDELIDLIEKIVIEEQEKETNITKKDPKGLKATKDVMGKNKKDNEDYVKDVSKKMMEYLKDMSSDKYEPNPKEFPKRNEVKKGDVKKYTPSDAVEEYIANFSHPGMENLNYDEIKPNEDWVSDNIEGSSRTGNNPDWGNAVKTDFGSKVNKKRKDNLYQKEKARSYKKVAQPIDDAGEGKGEDSLDKMFQTLESKEERKTKLMNEEINKMKNIISYNIKTQ
jgi:hypothetical protein